MKILVINQFASAPAYNTGAGERHFHIASKLVTRGYDFTIVAGGVNHLFINNPVTKRLFNEEHIEGGRFIWVRLRHYRSESFVGRAYSWFEFLIKLFLFPVKKHTPDLVLVSSMSLWASIYGLYLSKRLGVPFILEIRDIWPMTPVEVGGYSKYHPFILLFRFLEKFAYRKSDAIISLMPRFDKHLAATIKTKKIVHWIPNAIDRNLIFEKSAESPRDTTGIFTVAYAGALGYANAMECFINAANLLVDHEMEFIIIGDGPERKSLQMLASGNSKVKFIDKMPKHEVLSLLKNVDAGFISWRDLNLYKYGVSANKYNDYMLACLPIISCGNIADDPVITAGCGLQVPAGDERKIAEAVLILKNMSFADRRALGMKGYDYVLGHNTYEQIALQYETCLNQTVSDYRDSRQQAGLKLK